MILSFINIRKVPREVLKTSGFALGYQHFPLDLANIIEWKIMFDPSIVHILPVQGFRSMLYVCEQLKFQGGDSLKCQLEMLNVILCSFRCCYITFTHKKNKMFSKKSSLHEQCKTTTMTNHNRRCS